VQSTIQSVLKVRAEVYIKGKPAFIKRLIKVPVARNLFLALSSSSLGTSPYQGGDHFQYPAL